ncbi:hypothetical protein BURMUCF2_0612 [Burkholderia multivorans CF2]|jgi:hypothetical protein|nr:hypothetical protein BURMUCF2_0612 [Burkholderia multivorans CF2]
MKADVQESVMFGGVRRPCGNAAHRSIASVGVRDVADL